MTDTGAHNLGWRPKLYPAQSCRNLPDPALMAQTERQLPPLIPVTIQAVNNSDAPSTGRTIVICLDGTGDQFDADNSNVVQFMACLRKDLPNQITYYQSGIGTYDKGGMTSGFSAAMDAAVGGGLGVHIRDAYAFLMQNYIAGDKICIIGFSRGSYTARCLAGMLHKVGLLPAYNTAQINFAYKFYKDDSIKGWELSREFKATFCQNIVVYFIGIWDCVASVGVIPRRLPFSKSASNVTQYFRHAMALDEHRAKFKICRWQRDDPVLNARVKLLEEQRFARRSENQKRLEAQFESEAPDTRWKTKSDVKEVWFTGAHCDVGGGAVPNGTRHRLARIPLRWMIRQCFECNTEIIFNTINLAEIGLDVPTLWPIYKTPTKPVTGPPPNLMEKYLTAIEQQSKNKNGKKDPMVSDIYHETVNNCVTVPELIPEQAEDHFDALAPIFDQLEIAKGWWVLELWPVKVRLFRQDLKRWEKHVRLNMGRFRAVQDENPMLHWTVQTRMNELGYKIRARRDPETNWQIVA